VHAGGAAALEGHQALAAVVECGFGGEGEDGASRA